MSVSEHKKQAPGSVKCTVITVSDTRTLNTDKSGHLMMEFLEADNHHIIEYSIIKDDFDHIVQTVKSAVENPEVDAVILNGGTGISKRDVSVEAVQSILTKEIPGFGELFRMFSYKEDIGTAAILSRAVAGVCETTAVFSIPGSSGAVKLAMNRLILPELPHIIHEIKKDQ
ncbi:molybdenum cofactor biosynthesis protein B [Halobacillus yeomjeoni]|uniref:Molybdenum cofactor biosynthesis protein B n=1 Tax=Halobacillus yeomjeoni TaxID=311194 RepID=A0A931HV80_9BACI|nr:molybdenum cofactor biosynthesis protein B [Halobacillus yeomjeoni]MBH0230154.1 molybdenum cofactor biosynthesis protein MoaB [Halobacillus yeomjeoni]